MKRTKHTRAATTRKNGSRATASPARRRGRIRTVLLALAASAAAFAAVRVGITKLRPRVAGLLRESPLFTVRTVVVDIDNEERREEVASVAGVVPGVKMIDVRPLHVAEKVTSLSWVNKVRVTRLLPNTIRIGVTQRVPIALVCAGRVFWADKEGVLVPLQPGAAPQVPVITGLLPQCDSAGWRLPPSALRRLGAFLRTAHVAGSSLPAIAHIEFADNGIIRVRFKAYPAMVEFREDETAHRLADLRKVTAALEQGDRPAPVRIDLRFENLAFVE